MGTTNAIAIEDGEDYVVDIQHQTLRALDILNMVTKCVPIMENALTKMNVIVILAIPAFQPARRKEELKNHNVSATIKE